MLTYIIYNILYTKYTPSYTTMLTYPVCYAMLCCTYYILYVYYITSIICLYTIHLYRQRVRLRPRGQEHGLYTPGAGQERARGDHTEAYMGQQGQCMCWSVYI